AESFARFAARRLGWRVEPEGITAVSDVVVGIAELLRLLTAPGEGVIINPPVYHPFFELVPQVGRKLVEVPLDDSGDPDLEAIERAFAAGARALVLCSPHNPVGRVVAPSTLEALAELAAAHDAWVISDEIHAPLLLPGARHVAFTSVSAAAAERGIVLSSASKAFNVAGLKCALAITEPGPARERLRRLEGAAVHVGHLGVLASEAAFDAGDAWLDEVIATLDSNRRLLAELLARQLPAAVYRPPDASYLAWIDLRGLRLGVDPAELCLIEGRLALSSGPQFGREGVGFARLNFATSPELLGEAVKRMASAVAANSEP
ncbi:MAG: aminotransferase class I/II-fold pyridoxal phosphate-dependent enzyme, partial [Solirubrobacterales bacterium]|nr:aminotransferase class I/II-fold pyridoxal phosphate-dependent enzyme [Solirubrobacterales bacterium]